MSDKAAKHVQYLVSNLGALLRHVCTCSSLEAEERLSRKHVVPKQRPEAPKVYGD